MPFKLTIARAIWLLTAAPVPAYLYLPVNRVAITSERVMLGDLNNDNQWDAKDAETSSDLLADPFRCDRRTMLAIDLNRNGLIDEEDVPFREHCCRVSDPWRGVPGAAPGFCESAKCSGPRRVAGLQQQDPHEYR